LVVKIKKLNIAFNIKDVPDEVMKAWGIEMASKNYGVGLGLYNEYMDIVNRYPEWFTPDNKQELPIREKKP
jgi:hypothetical protein